MPLSSLYYLDVYGFHDLKAGLSGNEDCIFKGQGNLIQNLVTISIDSDILI
jgi:hypothetical protein